jgi:hypothetical protein
VIINTRGWFVLFVAAVFGAGVAVGMILDRYLERSVALSTGTASVMGPPPPPLMLVARLAQELDLSPDQQRQLDSVLNVRLKEFEGLREDARTRFDAAHRDLQADLERILTPEQKKRLETLMSQLRSGRGFGFGPGPGRGRYAPD